MADGSPLQIASVAIAPGITIATIAGWLPSIAALLAVILYVIQIRKELRGEAALWLVRRGKILRWLMSIRSWFIKADKRALDSLVDAKTAVDVKAAEAAGAAKTDKGDVNGAK